MTIAPAAAAATIEPPRPNPTFFGFPLSRIAACRRRDVISSPREQLFTSMVVRAEARGPGPWLPGGRDQVDGRPEQSFFLGPFDLDPELRHTPSGLPSPTRDGDQRSWPGRMAIVEEAPLHRRHGLGSAGRNLLPIFEKGKRRPRRRLLKMDTWDDKTTGEKRTKMKVQAERVQFLDRRDESQVAHRPTKTTPACAREPQARRGPRRAGDHGRWPRTAAAPAIPQTYRPPVASGDELDDDIPF